MAETRLKIPKFLKEVTLWVHPEGRVIGSLFLREQSINHAGLEEPIEVLNQEQPFIVLQLHSPDELRFYNLSSIVRVENANDEATTADTTLDLACTVHLMDGAMIPGIIRERLPQDHSRLFDYLNRASDRFVKIHCDDDTVCLVNKSYIIQVTGPDVSDW
jgi:hypothetical protein